MLEQKGASPPTVDSPPVDTNQEDLGDLQLLLGRLYRWWVRTVVILLLLGTVYDLIVDGSLETETIPLRQLPRALPQMDSAAFESLALVIITLGPVSGLLAAVVYSLHRGDRRTGLLAFLALLVLAALPIVRLLAGS